MLLYLRGTPTWRLDCEQSLYSSKIRGKERKTSKRANVTVTVMFALLLLFAFFPTDFRGKERLFAVYMAAGK